MLPVVDGQALAQAPAQVPALADGPVLVGLFRCVRGCQEITKLEIKLG